MPGIRTPEQIAAELAEIDNERQPSGTGAGSDEGESGGEGAIAREADERDASRQGWVPKDKYKGDPAKWKPADKFLSDGRRFNVNLQREVETLRAQVSSFEGTKQQFIKFHEEALARKDDELKEAIGALRVQRSQAMRDGEDELAVQLEDRIDLLREQQKEVKKIPQEQETANAGTGISPELMAMRKLALDEWLEDGNREWFDGDTTLRAYAVSMGDQMRKEGDRREGRAFLDAVTDRVKEDFPRKFAKKEGQPRTDTTSGGAAGGNGPASGGIKVSDLPEEDAKMMRDLIKGGYTTKEKFLASYGSTAPRRHS